MQEDAEPKFDRSATSTGGPHGATVPPVPEEHAYLHDAKVECLRRKRLLRGPLLDYGCGTGKLTERFLREQIHELHGYDPSKESLAEARRRVPSARLHTDPSTLPRAHFATAVLSGVLHHVAPRERAGVLATVREKLRPGGHVIVFEHNPLSPPTRKAVAACPFDDDAILLWPWEARRLLQQAGFEAVTIDYVAFFQKRLAFLRPLEPHLRRVPLGAQQLLVGVRR